MTSFTTKPQPKFDTTDLFAALQSPNQECDFPSLSWDNWDDDDHEEDDHEAMPDASGSDRRRSLSASCLLGKRPRGLVRSKTMKEAVDRLVLQHQQAAFPCTA
jgi:hypothetical protein